MNPANETILTSELLSLGGVRHGFTTRSGGVSKGDFQSLNLSERVGDDPGSVQRNRVLFEQMSGVVWPQMVCLNQVHSASVMVVDRPNAALPPVSDRRFDACVTDRPDAVLGVLVADCVPVLLASGDATVVAAVHAGWRGSLAGVAQQTVQVMVERFGCRPDELVAAIGPCIRTECYRVDRELAEKFAKRYGKGMTPEVDGQPHLDLVSVNFTALMEVGVRHDHIDVLGGCTSCDGDRFFSYRRDGGRTGRQLAFIGIAR